MNAPDFKIPRKPRKQAEAAVVVGPSHPTKNTFRIAPCARLSSERGVTSLR